MVAEHDGDAWIGDAYFRHRVFTGLLAASAHHKQITPPEREIMGRAAGKQPDTETTRRPRGDGGYVCLHSVFQLVPMPGDAVSTVTVPGKHEAVEYHTVAY